MPSPTAPLAFRQELPPHYTLQGKYVIENNVQERNIYPLARAMHTTRFPFPRTPETELIQRWT